MKITHGPNAVISMLHHCLHNFEIGENECIIHADNCAGNFVLLLLIHTGVVSFLINIINLIVSTSENKIR